MAGKIRVCILDLYPVFRYGLACLIDAQPDFRVDLHTADPKAALSFISNQQPEIVLLDIETPRLRGFEILRRRRLIPAPEVNR